ncbi:MAG: hypothetical protein ABSF26_24685, partial [Thermoguttaceae bacterium]
MRSMAIQDMGGGVTVQGMESGRHTPCAVRQTSFRFRGRHTECACYLGVTRLTAALGLVLLAARPVAAENVDLSTVPARHSVQLTIYNSEDLTLVRETRKVSFRPGV